MKIFVVDTKFVLLFLIKKDRKFSKVSVRIFTITIFKPSKIR